MAGHEATGTVAVVGGGLAGLTAAIDLAERGRHVLLLESRPRLGGATASFTRDAAVVAPGSGEGAQLTVDTGQHVLLRCYTAQRALLERLGTADRIVWQDRFDLPMLLPGDTRANGARVLHLRRSRWLPAPLHLAPALAGCAAFGPAERVRAAEAALALRRIDPDDPAADERSFGSFLAEHHQPPRVVRRLWGLLTVAALNLDPDHASLALAARVLRTGLLDDRTAGDIGIPQVPLAALHARPAAALLRGRGAAVRVSARVRAIEPLAARGGGSGSTGGFVVRTDTAEAEVDQVVLATAHREAAAVAPRSACPDADDWAGLDASPIVNVHLLLDRPVFDLPFAAVPDSSVQWLFDKTGIAGLPSGRSGTRGQYLVTSVSNATAHLGTRADGLCRQQLDELRGLLPALSGARVLDSFVTREPRATFRQQPGTGRIRPPARTRLPGLALAGAWTRTGWPDTMEGAVRSGHTAAALLTGLPDRPDPSPGLSAPSSHPTLQEAR